MLLATSGIQTPLQFDRYGVIVAPATDLAPASGSMSSIAPYHKAYGEQTGQQLKT